MARLPGFGDRLREALHARGLTQADLARATGKGSGSVVRWLRGEIPEVESLRLVAVATGQPMAWLLLGQDALREIDALLALAPSRRADLVRVAPAELVDRHTPSANGPGRWSRGSAL
jgi:transcriptional regulator with XRE-family HTH domain